MPPAHLRIRASPPNFAADSPQIMDRSRRQPVLLGQTSGAAARALLPG